MFKHHIAIHPHVKKGRRLCHLFLVVSINGERKEIPTGIACPTTAYNKQTTSIIAAPGYDTAPLDNLQLQRLLAECNRIMVSHELATVPSDSPEGEPTLATILTEINAYLHPEQVKPQLKASTVTVVQAYDKYLNDEKLNAGWSAGTLRHKKVNRGHYIAVFRNEYLQNINDDSLLVLLAHFSNSMRANTLAKFISDTRAFLRWCHTKGLYNGNSHETFQPTIKGSSDTKEIIYLTFDELKLLESRTWLASEQHLERVVDSFLFACFSGLRHSDVYALKRSSIYDETIHVRTIKTGVNIDIPLNTHTTRILEKYKDFHDTKNHPFPVISDQKSNKYIKEACKLCGIDTPLTISYTQNGKRIEETKPKYEFISFHCARRTFISNAFILGISPEIIIKFSGHANLKQLKPYLAISEKSKRDSMSKFDNI